MSNGPPFHVGTLSGAAVESSPNIVLLETKFHQEFQVPKMEVLNLIFGYFGGGFSLT